MEELGTLIKKSRVVLVSLNNKILPRADIEIAPKCLDQPTDHETRLKIGLLQEGGQNR